MKTIADIGTHPGSIVDIGRADANRAAAAKRIRELNVERAAHVAEQKPASNHVGTSWQTKMVEIDYRIAQAIEDLATATRLYDIARSPAPPGSRWYVSATMTAGEMAGRTVALAGPWDDPERAMAASKPVKDALQRCFPASAPFLVYGLSATTSGTRCMMRLDGEDETDPACWVPSRHATGR